MRLTYSSKELLGTVEAVTDFIAAAEALRESRGDDFLARAVAEAAGRASRASEMANFLEEHRDPPVAGGRVVRYDPIANWNAEIDPFVDQLSVAIETAHQIRGILESKAERARREERSAVGRVARFVGFPARVRKHLADRGFSAALQRAGFVTSIAGQIAIGVIASVVAWALITRLF